MPTKSEILNWRTDHLGAAAKMWGDQATQLDTAVNGAQGLLDGLQGSGQFVEAFRTRLKSYIDKTRPKVDKLKSAKQVAESSEQQLKGAKDKAVYAVHDPEDEDFNVNEDLSVTERRSHSGLDRLKRAIRRRWLQGILHTRAQELVATDNAIARKLHEIAQDLSNFHLEGPDGNTDFSGHRLKPGESRNLGPVAGTGAPIPGIGSADLGEVIEIPDGKGGKKLVAVFGDSFSTDHVPRPGEAADHYKSVAVEIKGFDQNGKPIWGDVLTGYDGENGRPPLFPTTGLPPAAQNTNTLSAGSIVMRDGTTYMMAAGTNDLHPTGGSWLVKAGDPSQGGWPPEPGTWRAGDKAPSQISGYQAADGTVYIAADSFDRNQQVTMYRVPPGGNVLDRDSWQPMTNTGWGAPGDPAKPLTTTPYGEVSLREVDGRPVLSGLNMGPDPGNGTARVEMRVGSAGDPSSVFAWNSPATVLMQQADPTAPNFVLQNYGGYILPGSTLDNMRVFGSQWVVADGTPYNTQLIEVNPHQ